MNTSAAPLLSRPFIRFVLVNGVAAAANFGSRILFSFYVSFPLAVVLAFFVGLSTSFVLSRRLVFADATQSLGHQVFWFVVINLVAVLLTLAVSMAMLNWLLPMLGISWHASEIAHAAGVAAPAVASYFGHRNITFR